MKNKTTPKILTYELGAPKFDVYTTEVFDKEWKRHNMRCLANFVKAYEWGLEQINLYKNSSTFCIIGEKFKKREYTKESCKEWYNKPFNRMDCGQVTWDFDKSGELYSRLYDYFGIGFEYMPSDTEADAGTHFQKGDFVKVNDVVWVISLIPGRKKDNRWENSYAMLRIIKKDDGRIYSSHEHFRESEITKYTKPIDKASPLWFLHQVFAGEIKLTKKQGNVVDSELKLVNGKWCGSLHI